jgi:hypothetical protein
VKSEMPTDLGSGSGCAVKVKAVAALATSHDDRDLGLKSESKGRVSKWVGNLERLGPISPCVALALLNPGLGSAARGRP